MRAKVQLASNAFEGALRAFGDALAASRFQGRLLLVEMNAAQPLGFHWLGNCDGKCDLADHYQYRYSHEMNDGIFERVYRPELDRWRRMGLSAAYVRTADMLHSAGPECSDGLHYHDCDFVNRARLRRIVRADEELARESLMVRGRRQ